MDLSLIAVAIIFLVITFLAALVGTLLYRRFFRRQSSKTDRQSEDDKAGMNRFGITLREVMNELGIEGSEEILDHGSGGDGRGDGHERSLRSVTSPSSQDEAARSPSCVRMA